MNSQLYKWLARLAVYTCLIFIASNVAAKKPIKDPPPDSNDNCTEQTNFSPDFAFWRSGGSRKAPEISIYLAESTTGCEKLLSSFSALGYTTELRYSSHLDDSGKVDVGRVVWMDVVGDSWEGGTIWVQDFAINGVKVIPTSSPEPILYSGTLDNPEVTGYVHDIDLSPDMETLAMNYIHRFSDGSGYSSIKVVEIAECLGATCTFSADAVEDLVNVPKSGPGYHAGVSWGPLGNRIYTVWWSESHTVQYLDVERIRPEKWGLINYIDLFSSEDHPESKWMANMRDAFSGVRTVMGEERVFLAVNAEPSSNESCENIYIVDVENCMTDPSACEVEPAFSGRLPSWTRNGEIIHSYEGWTLRGKCDFKQVGVWNGSDLSPVLEGAFQDAAGGLPR